MTTTNFFTITILLIIGIIGSIQNVKQKYMGHSLWPQQTQMLQIKELKATFNRESASMESVEELSSEEITENSTQEQRNSGEEKMATNRVKRESDAEQLLLSASAESEQLDDETVTETASKTETTITGNANRFQNLVNLPVQLNVLANVLSKLNMGVLDSKSPPSPSNSISGNGNVVSSLVNAPANVDVIANVLSDINKDSGKGSVPSQGGLVAGVLGGLLGGGGRNSSGLLNGLLGGGDNAGSLGGLLGNNLGDLLGALLGGDGLVGELLGGQDGKVFLAGLLNNLLASVVQLVDKLLELLVGLLDALLLGLGGKDDSSPSFATAFLVDTQSGAAQNLNIEGNNNQVSSLVSAPIHIKAVIDSLTSLKQQLQQAMEPTVTSGEVTASSGLLENSSTEAATFPSLSHSSSTSSPPSSESSGGLLESVLGSLDGARPAAGSDLLENLLEPTVTSGEVTASSGLLENSSTEAATFPSLSHSSSTSSPPSSESSGGLLESVLGSLDGARPAAGSDLLENLLGNTSTEASASSSLSPTSSPSSKGLLGSVLGSLAANAPADGSTSILGNNNTVSSLLNVAPDLHLNLNILSQVTDLLKNHSSGDGISKGSKPNEICFDVPLNEANTSITGNNNTISNAINVQPKINLDLNLLSKIQQTGAANVPTQKVCITMPHQRAAADPSTTSTVRPHITLPSKATTVKPTLSPIIPTLPSPPGEICFHVWVNESGAVIAGNNNQVNSLLNLPVNLNLDLNVLSKVEQGTTNLLPNAVMRKVCIPEVLPPTTTPAQPTTESSIDVAVKPRCFRRTCTRWRQFVDYDCSHNSKEHNKYTIVEDVH